MSYALTPSHLIYGRQISSHLNDRHYEIVSTITTLTKRAKHQQRILAQFTKQWRKEYLLSLRESAKLSAKSSRDTIKIKIGEIVILRNDSTKRVFWKFGKVDELIPSKDGIVRAAKIRVQGDGGKQVFLRRPIQHSSHLKSERSYLHQNQKIHVIIHQLTMLRKKKKRDVQDQEEGRR